MTIEEESMVYDFKECDDKQREHTEAFKVWLESRGNIKKYWDASDREDKEDSIDIWAETNDSKIISFQVKVDFKAKTTGNIVFETISQGYKPDDSKESKIGWGFKLSKVDYLSFLIVGSGDIYIFKPQAYVEWVLENMNGLRPFRTKNKNYITCGVLVPIASVKHLCFLQANIDDAIPMYRDEEGR